MALAILTIACLLLYATSKYFPKQEIKWIDQNKKTILWTATALAILSLIILNLANDFGTSLVFWMIAFMTILSAVILSVKMNIKWIWVWGGLCVIFLLIDVV
ncbi:MAG: hypothetical protein AAF600_04735 [Bacteroidota bacterium]